MGNNSQQDRIRNIEIDELLDRVIGAPLPDRVEAFTGAQRRNCERWLSNRIPWPPTIVADLERLAPLVDEMMLDLKDVIEEYLALGVPEHLIRMRMRDASKSLSDEPPPKPPRSNSSVS